jgi:beta-lactamase regulating signal transducer with metallopeptidase domain
MTTTAITSWLLTYLVHSTALLGAAWLISRTLSEHRLALQETILRTALIGGLLTTTLQVGLGIEPVSGALAIDGLVQSKIDTASYGAAAGTAASDSAVLLSPDVHNRTDDVWPVALLSLWGIGSLMALLVLGRSALDLQRLLKTRRIRAAGRLVERLAATMGLRRSFRLSTSEAIAVPFATGIRHPEICCPERVSDLAIEHQTGLFAHELAHLARRDPAWQLLYRLGEAIFFLQPLNRLVRRRLEEIAEHLTDERAVACTGNRLGLARCLVVVAHWGISAPPGVPAMAFAAGPRLDRRVRHLISGTVGQHDNAPWTAPLLIALLVGSVILLPAIAPSTVHADLSPGGSDVAPMQTWSFDSEGADSEEPAPPLPPESPSESASPQSVVPVTETSPALEAAPHAQAEPRPDSAPAPLVEPAPATVPESRSEPAPPEKPEPGTEPAPPASPDAPTPPPRADEPGDRPASEAPLNRQREQAREEARARQREAQRERSEAEARVREQARALSEERRALVEQARELSREAAERSRLTEAEREKLRSEAREHAVAAEEIARELAERSRQLAREAAERTRLNDAEREEFRRLAEEHRAEAREHARAATELSREHAERSRQIAREAAERTRLNDAEREEFRRRAEEHRAEAREQARELAEKARRLAEEAEAERQIEKDRRQRERNEK